MWFKYVIRVLTVVSALSAAVLSSRAEAQTCTIPAFPDVLFGTYDVYSAINTDSASTVSWSCSNKGIVTVTLTKGSSTTYTPRTLLSGANTLGYNLYLDAARTVIWGDGTGGSSFLTVPANVTQGPTTIYARIPAQQDAMVGTYADTITLVFTF